MTAALDRAVVGMDQRLAMLREMSGRKRMERDEFLRLHPLPWAVSNTLIWDADNKLIDIARREVRELLVDLVNQWGLKEEQHGHGKGGVGAERR